VATGSQQVKDRVKDGAQVGSAWPPTRGVPSVISGFSPALAVGVNLCLISIGILVVRSTPLLGGL